MKNIKWCRFCQRKQVWIWKYHKTTGNGGLWKCENCGKVHTLEDLSVMNNVDRIKRKREYHDKISVRNFRVVGVRKRVKMVKTDGSC